MTLLEATVACIARLELRETANGPVCNQGSAFLIDSAGHVLTAWHAVELPSEDGGPADPPKERFITLYFHGPGGALEGARDGARAAAGPMKATLVRGAAEVDCALLQLVGCDLPLPDAIIPIPLHAFPVGQGARGWATYGYAEFIEDGRGVLDGSVRFAGSRRVELEAKWLTNETWQRVQGLSGGPCIVGGGAVGINLSVPLRDGVVQRATLFVVPMTAVAEAVGLKMDLPPTRELPYEQHFEAAIQKLTPAAHDELADVLRIARFATIGQPERVRYIVRMMLLGGAMMTLSAVHASGAQLDERMRKELIALGLTLWVDGAAARTLAEALERGRYGAINTSRIDTAKEYVTRACAVIQAGAPGWQKRCLSVLPPDQEPLVDGYIAAVGREIDRARLKPPFYAAKVIVLLSGPPRSDLVAALAAKYRGLRVIFLAELPIPDALRAQLPDVTYVEPDLRASDEASALADREEIEQLTRDL